MRVATLEAKLVSNAPPSSNFADGAIGSISDQLQAVVSRCDEAENRMRRCNLLFFGIPDEHKENWETSENKIIAVCSDKLAITTTSSQYERVHRLGKFASNKCRPIIAKFTFFKDKQAILAGAHRLKNTGFSIREDFSQATRQAHRKLLQFARERNCPFKLNVDKLRIDNTTYIYDTCSDTVLTAR